MSRRLVLVADSVLFTLACQAVFGGLLGRLYESLGWMTMPVWLVVGVCLARIVQRRGAGGQMSGVQRLAARLVALVGIALGLFFGDTTPAKGGQFVILLIVLGWFALFTAAAALAYDLFASRRARVKETPSAG